MEGELGKGSTFTAYMKFAKANNRDLIKSESPGNDLDALHKKKILLFEDDAINRELGVTILKSRGMEVDCAISGIEGARKFAETFFGEQSAVLMDTRMP